jgi:hypothetical protein
VRRAFIVAGLSRVRHWSLAEIRTSGGVWSRRPRRFEAFIAHDLSGEELGATDLGEFAAEEVNELLQRRP